MIAPVQFAIGPCILGVVGVAVGDAGVRAVALGDSAPQVEAELRAQVDGQPWLEAELAELAVAQARVQAPGDARLALVLDPVGTPFQHAVWRALAAIPAGQVCTYAQVAAAIGAPTSARAVAGACAANRIALFIPCHRVVRADGSLSGFRWGVARKRALLAAEGDGLRLF